MAKITLEQMFEYLAVNTWDVIGNAHASSIMYGEDAVTSVNLLSINNLNSQNIVIIDTRIDESQKGCDFEFWIGSDNKGWYRYAIQAKKLRVSDQTYASLKHDVAGVPQIDILDSYSQANRAIPLYCLYNFYSKSVPQKTKCKQFKKGKEFGCSITPLQTAKKALSTRGARKFTWFHSRPETIPWSCLVRCKTIERHWQKYITDFNGKAMRHDTLPAALGELLEMRRYDEFSGTQVIDAMADDFSLNNSEMFSRESEFRPGRVAIFEVEEAE